MQSKIELKSLLFIFAIIFIIFLVTIIYFPIKLLAPVSIENNKFVIPVSYHENIIKDTEMNENFRHVLFTGLHSQLVIMSIPPGGEVGEEIHKYAEQTLFFLSGTGVGELNDKKFSIIPGDVVVVVPGTKHNFWNTGTNDLKIYTVYAPPNHIDGRIHKTKADSDADKADEAIGEINPFK